MYNFVDLIFFIFVGVFIYYIIRYQKPIKEKIRPLRKVCVARIRQMTPQGDTDFEIFAIINKPDYSEESTYPIKSLIITFYNGTLYSDGTVLLDYSSEFKRLVNGAKIAEAAKNNS